MKEAPLFRASISDFDHEKRVPHFFRHYTPRVGGVTYSCPLFLFFGIQYLKTLSKKPYLTNQKIKEKSKINQNSALLWNSRVERCSVLSTTASSRYSREADTQWC